MVQSLFTYYYANDTKRIQEIISAATATKRDLRDIVNKRDQRGRSLLHIASSEGRFDVVELLLSCKYTNTLALDAESGWTALHRALYAGHIDIAQALIAHSPSIVKQKDNEGLSPFELYNLSIPGTSPLTSIQKSPVGSDVYTFGANANATLGFADSDDRSFPERVSLHRNLDKHTPAVEKFAGHKIKAVHMSKLHSVVLTTDTKNNLFICGVGSSGRLGLGNLANTSRTSIQFQFTQVPLQEVAAVALGRDHTVAVTTSGHCYTWGLNSNGQLGYSISQSSPSSLSPSSASATSTNSFNSSPRRVTGALKKVTIRGAAASSIHTMAFSDDCELFAWGTNIGQMGFKSTDNGLQGPIEHLPRKVHTFKSNISLLSVSDRCSLCLLDNGEVWAFHDYSYRRVLLPGPSRDTESNDFTIFRPKFLYSTAPIVKIAVSGPYFALLDSNGDIYAACVSNVSRLHLKSIQATRIWTHRREHLKAQDVDIAKDGSVILCTLSGAVWKSSQCAYNVLDNSKRVPKYTRVSGISRAVSVTCSSAFTSFAVVVSESKPLPIYSPLGTLQSELLSSYYQAWDLPFPTPDIEYLKEPLIKDPSALAHKIDETECGHGSTTLTHDPLADFAQSYASFLLDNSCLRAKTCDNFDLTLKSKCSVSFEIPMTRFILSLWSEPLKLIFIDNKRLSTDSIDFIPSELKSVLTLNFTPQALCILAFFVHSGIVPPVFQRDRPDAGSKQLVQCKKELRHMAELFDIPELVQSIHRAEFLSLPSKLRKVCPTAVDIPGFCDVKILLKDHSIACNSFIMGARSSFFSTIMSHSWNGNNRKVIDLSHIAWSSFKPALMHIYGCTDISKMLRDVTARNLNELIVSIFDIVSVASELLLFSLSQSLQAFMLKYLSLRHAQSMLVSAHYYYAYALEKSLLIYIAQNIEALLLNEKLGNLSNLNIWDALHDTIVERQQIAFPLSRGAEVFAHIVSISPNIKEEINMERIELASESYTPDEYADVDSDFPSVARIAEQPHDILSLESSIGSIDLNKNLTKPDETVLYEDEDRSGLFRDHNDSCGSLADDSSMIFDMDEDSATCRNEIASSILSTRDYSVSGTPLVSSSRSYELGMSPLLGRDEPTLDELHSTPKSHETPLVATGSRRFKKPSQKQRREQMRKENDERKRLQDQSNVAPDHWWTAKNLETHG
ncbi:hypothetical protein CANCADRAFT_60650 [Tortispora caseinolytica NRRL Y-17796]|uniref:BTB domain-containing protein n=1 Tax=Tortispora caseinolytica NRRL Y-17796 TaxID=767744 RepID=A0A1E4TEY2_9ASCO|nr:hypothetical protein CANCADRAFT_60650 [Tortispora caseinolytica NRRL Y-17796]